MDTPYLDWISSHLKLYEWQSDLVYALNDIATVGSDMYISLYENNFGNNPINSNHWIKLV